MRSTLTRLAVVIVGLFATAAIAGGTAHADEPEDEPTLFLTCPPFCEVPNPPLEFCFEPNPEDCAKDDPVILEVACPPLCPEPTDEPLEEPELEPADEPADEPAQPTSGSQGGSNEPAAPAPDGSADATEEPEQDDSIVAPVNEFEEQASNTSGKSSNAALLAVLATGFGLLAGGGLAYTVMRRR